MGAALLYVVLALLLWWLNWVGINWLSSFGTSKNLTALMLIPFLAAFSYAMQRSFTFRQSR